MFEKLIGEDGLLFKTGKNADRSERDPPPLSAAPAAPIATSLSPGAAPSFHLSANPEILASTRKAVFEIPGSVHLRFAEEMKNLEDVISDTTTRIRAVVKTLRVSPKEIAQALSTVNRAALDTWKQDITRARDAGHAEKIATREQKIASIKQENLSINEQIARLQAQLTANAETEQTLNSEIAAAGSEIEQKARDYDIATQVVESELTQLITTLKSIS